MLQFDVANYIALFVTLGFILIRPSAQLHPVKPPRRLFSLPVLGPIAFYAVQQGIAVAILNRQSWFDPTQAESQVSTILCICLQLQLEQVTTL